MPKSRRKGKHTGAKWCVKRHRAMSAPEADRCERAIERQERQKAQREINERLEDQS